MKGLLPVCRAEDGDELLKAFLEAQERHQEFVEANPEARSNSVKGFVFLKHHTVLECIGLY